MSTIFIYIYIHVLMNFVLFCTYIDATMSKQDRYYVFALQIDIYILILKCFFILNINTYAHAYYNIPSYNNDLSHLLSSDAFYWPWCSFSVSVERTLEVFQIHVGQSGAHSQDLCRATFFHFFVLGRVLIIMILITILRKERRYYCFYNVFFDHVFRIVLGVWLREFAVMVMQKMKKNIRW